MSALARPVYRAAAVNEFLSNKCFKTLSLFVFKRISAVNVCYMTRTRSPTLISCSIERLSTSFISDNLSSDERGTLRPYPRSTGTVLY